MGLFKKMTCDHEFYKVGQSSCFADTPDGIEYFTVVYCPKCKKEKHVHELKYKLMIRKQEIDKMYRSKVSGS